MVPDPRLCVCEPTHYGIGERTLTKKKKEDVLSFDTVLCLTHL